MGRKPSPRWRAWIDDWVAYCDRAGGADRAVFQYSQKDVLDRARQLTSDREFFGLNGLELVVAISNEHKVRLGRCQVFIGREVASMRAAGATWAEIGNWGSLGDTTCRTMLKQYESEPEPGSHEYDAEAEARLGELTNPLRRCYELKQLWRFESDVYRLLTDLVLDLCAEAQDEGHASSKIARTAGISPVRLDERLFLRRLNRERHGG